MRDTRKSENYFDEYLSCEKDRIQKWSNKLQNETDEKKKGKLSLYLLNSQMNYLIASFSMGADSEELSGILGSLLQTAEKICTLTYQTQLQMLSFAVMLDFSQIVEILDADKFDLGDKLIRALWCYLKDKSIEWEGILTYPEYSKLNDVFLTKAADVLEKYLETWYEDNKSAPWYETLNSENNTYYGYWSFESAAVAKILDLPQNHLIEHPYYPVI